MHEGRIMLFASLFDGFNILKKANPRSLTQQRGADWFLSFERSIFNQAR
jgi:hypothetical protein